MGAAHCSVVNQTSHPICVITFNMADLIYKTYHTMYLIDPGETQNVEANPDPNGLKVGIVYETRRDKQEFFFHRFTCSNDSVLTITSVDGNDIDYYGEGTSLQGKGKLRESSVEPFNLAASTLQNETAKEKEPNRATQEVKKFLKHVKDQGEAVVKTVGNIDFSTHKEKEKENHSIPPNSSNGSLATITTADRSHLPPDDSQHFAPPLSHSIATTASNNVPFADMKKQTSTSLLQQNSYLRHDEIKPVLSHSSLPSPKSETSEETKEKWEAELERAKKEKRWEQEIERIKRERQERALEEAEEAKHPHRYHQQTKSQTAPVADANCQVCIIS